MFYWHGSQVTQEHKHKMEVNNYKMFRSLPHVRFLVFATLYLTIIC